MIKKFNRFLNEDVNFDSKYHALSYDGDNFNDIYFDDFNELINMMDVSDNDWNNEFLDKIKQFDEKGQPFIFIISPYHLILNGKRFLELCYHSNRTPLTKEEVIDYYNIEIEKAEIIKNNN